MPLTNVLGRLSRLQQRQQVRQLSIDLGHLGRRVDRRQTEKVTVSGIIPVLLFLG